MVAHTILYHLALAAVDVAVLIRLGKKRTVGAWAGCWASVGLAAGLFSPMGGPKFIPLLLAYGLFLHFPAVFAVSAVLLCRTHRKSAAVSAVAALVILAVAVDAFCIEPTWLEVTYYELASPKIRRLLRIVVVADLQTDGVGRYEREALSRALAQQPDLILLAGDYLQAKNGDRQKLREDLNGLLGELHFAAPAGAFAVQGNIDPDDWAEGFSGLPITTATSTRSFLLPDVRLTCLSRAASFSRRCKLPSTDSDRFHVVLGHSPNFALGQVHADLLIAGHTHGGQVRLPLVGPLFWGSRIPAAWSAGMTELPGGARLIVSRGVGMERGDAPRLRFLCRPELVVIDLVPQGDAI